VRLLLPSSASSSQASLPSSALGATSPLSKPHLGGLYTDPFPQDDSNSEVWSTTCCFLKLRGADRAELGNPGASYGWNEESISTLMMAVLMVVSRTADGYKVCPTLSLRLELFYSQHDTIAPYARLPDAAPAQTSAHDRALLRATHLVYAYARTRSTANTHVCTHPSSKQHAFAK
jgi:hypothetical protein